MNIAIVGGGVMGKGIVEAILSQRIAMELETVVWVVRDASKFEILKRQISRQLKKSERRLGEDIYTAEKILSSVQLTTAYEEIVDANLIIEAVSEDKATKSDVLRKINRFRNTNSIVASNTSSYSITELAMFLDDPERFVGLHFFNPAPVMSLVEVVKGLITDESVINQVVSFSKSIEKEAVIVNEAPGFIVNRMLIPMINEAIAIYAEGIAGIEEIDKAMKLGANHPIGPFSLSDLIGNDVVLSILDTLYMETGDAKYRPHTLLKKYVRANKLGRKTKSGFTS
ncbi:3-hydroxyacyl-CoA dehydrogenase family protein [Vibrio nigripulchritudo]|uniref:3-hydroxyacyl-CoA dehydrogenase family protein n=1 Tax=Vibrio nigripulchritudo TaxID=28173 RepID=UPI0003B1AA76|nr:3-hydroxyacyl-CoA dehydrogenase NAD-binding domain-containing protein [Vibrio nigripulchritudo]CCN70292.1 3-hydroxybutyryl-CoA dehydrogenase [Vibrio nigripulchritudo SFn118]